MGKVEFGKPHTFRVLSDDIAHTIKMGWKTISDAKTIDSIQILIFERKTKQIGPGVVIPGEVIGFFLYLPCFLT